MLLQALWYTNVTVPSIPVIRLFCRNIPENPLIYLLKQKERTEGKIFFTDQLVIGQIET